MNPLLRQKELQAQAKLEAAKKTEGQRLPKQEASAPLPKPTQEPEKEPLGNTPQTPKQWLETLPNNELWRKAKTLGVLGEDQSRNGLIKALLDAGVKK